MTLSLDRATALNATRPVDPVSPLVRSIPPSGIRRFFDLVAQTEGVISLGVGEPDFVTPWHIREASIYSLEAGRTTYTSNHGLPELRREISAYLARRYGVGYNPGREIVVTIGVAQAIDLALRAVISPGDEVLIPEPCFVSYAPCTLLAGGTPVGIPLSAEHDFKLRAIDLENHLTPRSKVLLIGFPNNPTGATMNGDELAEVAEVARRAGLLVISDEIYSELTYGGEHTCFAALPGMRDQTIVLNGFSKAFAMTGWRIGYAVGPSAIIDAMVKIHQYTAMCAPITGQIAAIEALRHGEAEMKNMVEHYRRRRNLVVSWFREMGLKCFEPGGAFYVFPSIAETGLTSEEFSERLLREEKVAAVPGTAFGASGEGHIRCSYATSVENLKEAMVRIGRFVRRVMG